MSASKISNIQPTLLGESSKTKKGSIEEKEKDDDEGNGERSPSPEIAKCAICLGDVVNRSRSNTCVHSFCFGCLLEWSKVKPECPLCKSSFTTIYHNYRSNTEYDEYVVPTPIPSFSIRFTASATSGNYRLSPFIRVLGASARTHQHSPIGHAYDGVTIPAGMFAPLPPPPPILPPANPFNNGTSSRPEFFGDVVNDHRRTQEEAVSMPGYQNRRRRYDRNEWVQPFGSTLQPGSVVFPSVEYVRTHPAAITRLRSWLFRELNVLLGLLRSREQMAFVYDLILHLINHYDVRSRDFRDMINSYFGSRTTHFQHELYHFLLSGMSMEEYDRVADYPSSSNGNNVRRSVPEVITLDSDDEDNSNSHFTCNNSNSNRSGGNTDDDDIIVLSPSSDDDAESNPTRLGSSPHVVASFSLPSAGRSYASAVASASGSRRHEATSPPDLSRTRSTAAPAIEMVHPEPERPRRHTTNRARVLNNNNNVDPEMPVLEPEIFPFNPVFEDVLMYIDEEMNPSRNLPRENRNNPTIDRLRATAATATVTDSSSNYGSRNSGHNAETTSRSSGADLPSFIETAEIDLDLDVSVETYSSPQRQDPRPLSSPDFPILRLRRDAATNRDRERDMPSWLRNQEADESSGEPPSCVYGNNSYSERRSESGSGSAFVPYEPEASNSRGSMSRPSRASCIHETSALRSLRHGTSASSSNSGYRPVSPAFRVNLYPRGISSSQVMDLSRSAGLISSSLNQSTSTSASSNVTTATQAPTATTVPRRAPSPTPSTSRSLADVINSFTASIHAAAGDLIKKPEIKKPPESVQNDSDDEDELECLGSFPIQKKPPLAVITLSSDDEEDEEGRVKTERNDLVESLNNLYHDDGLDTRIADSFLEWTSRASPTRSIEEIDLGEGPSYSGEFGHKRSHFSFTQSEPGTSGSGETSNATSARTSNNGLKISLRRDPFSGELSAGTDSPSSATSPRKRHISSSHVATPVRKSKRLRINSSSEDSDNDNEKTQSTSKISLTSSSASSTPVNIPKKRKYVEFDSPPKERPKISVLTSSDSSTDSTDSDEEFEITRKSKRGKTSKKHSSSSPKKKSKKSKSKKSKKTKKSKSKDRETRSKTRSGSSKTDKKASSSHGCSSSSRKVGTSKSSPGNSSTKSSQNSVQQSHSSTSASKSGTNAASASSSFMNLPLCSDLDIDESSSQTNGILDLSYHNPRTEARENQYSSFAESLIDDVFDLRVRHPSLTNESTTPALSSTVDVSAIFGSPSRGMSQFWDDIPAASGRRSSNNEWID